eukprot:jgi/Botrbrau1/19236/Bobra.0077s0133.1
MPHLSLHVYVDNNKKSRFEPSSGSGPVRLLTFFGFSLLRHVESAGLVFSLGTAPFKARAVFVRAAEFPGTWHVQMTAWIDLKRSLTLNQFHRIPRNKSWKMPWLCQHASYGVLLLGYGLPTRCSQTLFPV